MLLFTSPANMAASRVVIPLARIFDIYALDCAININYDSGELVEVAGKLEKKIETVRITFDTPDDVNKILRQFYKALNSGSRAFYFGNNEEKKMTPSSVEVIPPEKILVETEDENLMLNLLS